MNQYGRKISIVAGREPFWRDVRFWIVEKSWDPDKSTHHVGEVTMHPVKEGDSPPPTVTLKDEQAQQFMDELWRIGFRPTEGKDDSGQRDVLSHGEKFLALRPCMRNQPGQINS